MPSPNETGWVTVRATAGTIRKPRVPGVRTRTAVPPVVRRRLTWLVSVLGNNQVAELLGVNRSQPSRWRTGKEGLAPENRRAVLDLDYVVARLHESWTPEVAALWLRGSNAHLGGAVPLDVLKLRGAAEVIRAIDAEDQGAYA